MSDLYEHYKGNRYRMIGIAKHSETLEEMVVYQRESSDELWVRPKEMFFEMMPDGFPRFEQIEDE